MVQGAVVCEVATDIMFVGLDTHKGAGDDPCDGAQGGGFPVLGQVCDDGNPCTEEACDPEWGCQSTTVLGPCDDGDACATGDKCLAGKCSGAKLTSANKLDDGLVCTGGDHCASGKCVSGQKWNESSQCDDGDEYTIDFCVEPKGCIHADDNCDDRDPCTDDKSDPALGPVNSFNTAPCDDGNACADDFCNRVPGLLPEVNGANASVSENPRTLTGYFKGTCIIGCQVTCADHGKPSTAGDVCAPGICAPGAAVWPVCIVDLAYVAYDVATNTLFAGLDTYRVAIDVDDGERISRVELPLPKGNHPGLLASHNHFLLRAFSAIILNFAFGAPVDKLDPDLSPGPSLPYVAACARKVHAGRGKVVSATRDVVSLAEAVPALLGCAVALLITPCGKVYGPCLAASAPAPRPPNRDLLPKTPSVVPCVERLIGRTADLMSCMMLSTRREVFE